MNSSGEVERAGAIGGPVVGTPKCSTIAWITWIIDDTGFLKQGRHSVGVQRQYTGSAGKITNCQIGVSLTLATRADHVPIDFKLYLPKSWTGDRERRKEARIPAHINLATKPELALQMIRRALEAGLPLGTVLADAAYGGKGIPRGIAAARPRLRRSRQLHHQRAAPR